MNARNLVKPVDFNLLKEHFLAVADEAAEYQLKLFLNSSRKKSTVSQRSFNPIHDNTASSDGPTKSSLLMSNQTGEGSNRLSAAQHHAPSHSLHVEINEAHHKPKLSSLIKNDNRFSLFFLSIEIHSYVPVSRRTLSSTFRKKKKVYRGQCQIQDNFIRSTQFTKTFTLKEV
jgi:hypothetical protein